MLIVSFVEKTYPMSNNLFNSISCFSNTGYILGSIQELSWISKICYSLLMFIGRIGPITIVSALNRDNTKRNSIEYVEEKVVIG
jgi:trk system potassium uptake protein TrkH